MLDVLDVLDMLNVVDVLAVLAGSISFLLKCGMRFELNARRQLRDMLLDFYETTMQFAN